MYHNGQIVHSYTTGGPVKVGNPNSSSEWAWEGDLANTTHYIEQDIEHRYMTALPKTVEEARELLDRHMITPSPTPPTHHWRCKNWISNHDKGHCSCATQEK